MAATINADNGVSSGSAGLKSSADSSGVLQLQTNGTAAVTVNTSQNVGIGTASPSDLLEVRKDQATTTRIRVTNKTSSSSATASIFFENSTSNYASMGLWDSGAIGALTAYGLNIDGNGTGGVNISASNASGVLRFATGTSITERMRITSAGNVGIGIDTPSSAAGFQRILEIYDASSSTVQVNSGATYKAEFGVSSNGGWLGTGTNHAMRFATNSTERMRIDSSGNVGIGTNSPSGKLGVLTAADTKLIMNDGATAGNGRIASVNAAFSAYKPFELDTSTSIFLISGTERARITSSGELLVGTTSATGLVTAQRNTAGSYSAAFGARAIGTANSQVAGIMFLPTFSNVPDYTPRRAADIWAGFNGNWGGEFLVFGVGTGAGNDAGNQTVERMRIDAGGNLTITGATATKASGTTWANPSDQRLKDNIRDYVKGTTELMQIRVREWEYNGKGGTVEGMKGLGVIADEVMTVLPATVENYDAKLNADDEETTAIKKFDATEITWLLVKTVQEQQATIIQLQADVTALKGTA